MKLLFCFSRESKFWRRKYLLFTAFLGLFFTPSTFGANGDSLTVPTSTEPIVKKINNSEYQIGSVVLNNVSREISIAGKINMQKGLIELLACGPSGKKHESVIVLDLVPHDLHVALLLLGLEPHGNLNYQGDTLIPKGDSVLVFVEWNDASGKKNVRGEELVFDVVRKQPMQHTPWIFTGSRLLDGMYAADHEQSIITTYRDPLTILDNPLPSGSDDTVYEVNEKITPPKGTPVKVIIRALTNKQE